MHTPLDGTKAVNDRRTIRSARSVLVAGFLRIDCDLIQILQSYLFATRIAEFR